MTQGKDKEKGVSQVVDFEEVRMQRLNEKRRKNERVFFKTLLSVYCVVDGQQMKSLEVVDVSEDGISFQIPFDSRNPWPRDLKDMQIRLYFSQDRYIPLVIKVQNSRQSIDQGMRFIRYGCAVDVSTSAYPAYQQFVRFLKMFSEQAHKDEGDVTLFYV